nr:DUF397 domain-containing protein [Tamaricihabitans halophyticus]
MSSPNRANGQSAGTWRKSTYSGAGNDCVEVALTDHGAAVRDSKSPRHGTVCTSARGWHRFLDAIREDQLDS